MLWYLRRRLTCLLRGHAPGPRISSDVEPGLTLAGTWCTRCQGVYDTAYSGPRARN